MTEAPLPHLTKKGSVRFGTSILSKWAILIFPVFIVGRLVYRISTQGPSKQSTFLIVLVVVSFTLASGIVLYLSQARNKELSVE